MISFEVSESKRESSLSVALVRSLFCGLPEKERRMAVIVSASDETYRDKFVYGGVLASLRYWEKIFAPRWERDVLDGAPRIPFLHMTDIRSPKWRESMGISELEADRRVENAVQILCKRKEPVWIGFEFGHECFNDTLMQRIQMKSGVLKPFVADYFGFMGYAYCVLRFVRQMYPEVRKVDFLVERNGEVTKNLPEFYENFDPFLREMGAADYIGLLGDIIPGGKDRTPLQAADVLCWYLRRAREQTLVGIDLERYERLRKKKHVIGGLGNESLTELQRELKAQIAATQ
jgi:hypothetical protein